MWMNSLVERWMWCTEQMMMSSATWKHWSKKTRAEALGGLLSNIYRTVMGTHRKTHRNKITDAPDTLVTENNSSNTLDNLEASYLGNVVSLTNPKRDNIGEQVLTEQLNGLVLTTFHNLFQHINTDSLSEVSPKVKQYNKTISRFIADTSNRNGIILSYTSLLVEDVTLWALTFNIITKNAVANTNNQNSLGISTVVNTQDNRAELHPTEQPVETTTRQQREIERLCKVADQGIYRRSHQPPSSRGRPCSIPNVSPVHLGVENGYRDDKYRRYNHNDRR